MEAMNAGRKTKIATMETIENVAIMCGASLMGAIGLLALWGGITGVEIWELGAVHVAGILTGLFGGILGTLLLGTLFRKKR